MVKVQRNMRIGAKLLRWILGSVVSLAVVYEVVWKLPGSIADVLSTSDMNREDLKRLAALAPARESFVVMLKNFFTLHWGKSLLYNDENLLIIRERLANTFFVTGISLVLLLILVFVALAVLPKNFIKRSSALGMAVPALVFYPLVVFVLCLTGHACPAGSVQWMFPFFLAAFSQALLIAPRFQRELLWELEHIEVQDYIRTARAKGLGRRRIFWIHELKNLMAPLFSLLLLYTLYMLAGSVLLETLFDIRGAGALLLEAVRSRDLPLIMPLVALLALLHYTALSLGRHRSRRDA